ncbi:MAG: TIGR01906 family membrane protein [Defluviitaleaceae bacterium]|nr:TIGR01906 family membrane protein [Defluviitaleaceae bacterium]
MWIKVVLSVLNTFAVLAMFLVTAIWIPTFNMDYYRAHYDQREIPRRIGVSETQLMEVTRRLTDYMRGRADDIVISVEAHGVTREFFDERDTAHMVDVRALFDIARAGFVLAVLAAGATWAWAFLRKELPLLFRVSLWVLAGFLAAFALLALMIALDFDASFIIFHLIFFNNDLWILDPAVSLLINIVPQDFFVDISLKVGMLFGGMILGYAGLMAVMLRKWKNA